MSAIQSTGGFVTFIDQDRDEAIRYCFMKVTDVIYDDPRLTTEEKIRIVGSMVEIGKEFQEKSKKFKWNN